jgi:hypothetical protein
MNDNENDRFEALRKLVNDHGYPIPCYCVACNKQVGSYFKTGTGRWDGKPSTLYCQRCEKEIKDSSKTFLG